jgi:glucose dehydrogenase
MSRPRHINVTIGMRLLALFSIPLLAADWPGWRGPNRDGVITEEPKTYPEKLNLKWRTDIGLGHSSPILAAGSIYAFTRQGEQETVSSIDPATGKVRWQQQYPAPYKVNSAASSHGPGPKSTPLYSDGKLYTFGISGILSCLDAQTGKLRWRKEFSKNQAETAPVFGTATSPILDHRLLIVHVGGEKTGAITAFDPGTGDMKWSWDGDSPAYASPVIFESRGVRQVVTQSRQNIIGLDEATGKLLWKIPFTTAFEQNIVTPLVLQRYTDFFWNRQGSLRRARGSGLDANALANQRRVDVHELTRIDRRPADRILPSQARPDLLSRSAHGRDVVDRLATRRRQRRDARQCHHALLADL